MDYSLKINLFLKRIIDILGSIIGMILFAPITIIGIAALYLESGWPVFYSHTRVGKDGVNFSLHKIRSMVLDADQYLWESHPELLEEYKKNGYKLKNDPRITKVGKFLRRYDIEEVPQFFNVLKGDMSLIGPRAYKPNELKEQGERNTQCKDDIQKALTVKPGISGLWQVSGRNTLGFNERIKLDAYYATHFSLWLDLKILLQTPFAVFRSHGD